MRRDIRAACAALAPLLLACAAAARAPHEDLEARIVEVADRVKPSVVHIEAIVKFNDRRNQVTGSGVIVSADGSILTNEHVVDKAQKVTVTVPGLKKKYPARIVGADRQTDVALLRIRPDVRICAWASGCWPSAIPTGSRARCPSASCPPRGATSRCRTCSTPSSRPTP
jgi:S1-C subfamily serine protease